MTLDTILAFVQVALAILNIILVPIIFSGVKWVISVEKRLAQIQTLIADHNGA